MLATLSSGAIITKIKAMYGGRLTAENYKALLGKHSVGEVASYLKNETHYGKELSSVSEGLIHRGHLEALLERDIFAKYIRLVRYASEKNGGIYRYYMISVEIEQILSCLRLLNSGQLEEYIKALPGHLISHLSFNILELAEARSFTDVIKVLGRTPYAKVLTELSPNGELPSVFDCEHALRTYYYNTVHKLIDSFAAGTESAQLHDIFYLHLQLVNLTSIYRLKRYFNFSPDEIKKNLILTGDKKLDRMLTRLCETADAEELAESLKPIKALSSVMSQEMSSLESSAKKARLAHGKRLMTFTTYPSVAFVCYMLLCRIETDNIITIIEGKRYSIPESEIERMLVI